MFGADEAGRGPALGSLFIGFVDASEEALPSGLADSKVLSNDRIETFAETLYSDPGVTTTTVEIPPEEIDAEDGNVTRLTAAAMAEAIDNAVESERGIVDACHPDPDAFADMVTAHVTQDNLPAVTAEHEADTRIPQVMAASIIAKYEREKQIESLADEHGPVGSGYPSDPTTQEFLEEYVSENGDLPPFARTSWQTSKDVVEAVHQAGLDEFNE